MHFGTAVFSKKADALKNASAFTQSLIKSLYISIYLSAETDQL
jgi:hypothetical protein